MAWLPPPAAVLLLADRFYPSVDLFHWLQSCGWGYRLRLKGNLLVDPGYGDEVTTGELAAGVKERYVPGVRLFADGISTHLGILHEAGHPEPWIIAMNCPPTRAAVLDYGARWGIEPMFSDFKGRGFELGDSQLDHADRLERLILIMALAMYWCVGIGTMPSTTRRRSKKSPSADRPGPLDFQKAPAQPGVLVQTRAAPLDAVPAKRHPFASVLCRQQKLIGDEGIAAWSGPRPGKRFVSFAAPQWTLAGRIAMLHI